MPTVMVHKAEQDNEMVADHVLSKNCGALETVRQRAYELFEMRGCQPGKDVEDWLQAEQEMLFVPEASINESAKTFTVTISTPGFGADDVEVTASPQEVLVEAKARTMQDGRFESRTLYRRFDLASPIDSNRVTASMDGAELTIKAPKRETRSATSKIAAA